MLPDSYSSGEWEGDMSVLRWTSGSIAPLLLNRQCYHEALYAMYSLREFYVYLADSPRALTVQPPPRSHFLFPAAAEGVGEELGFPQPGAKLVSRLSVHVYVKELEPGCLERVRRKIEGVVRSFEGRRLAILRIKFTFALRRFVPLEPAEVKRRTWFVFAGFNGVRAKKLFVEVQGHWVGVVMDSWCEDIVNMLRKEAGE
jgi:hypothetical protein